MKLFILICAKCDMRVFLGGNDDADNPRLVAAISAGWHVPFRQEPHCPTCWKKMQTERVPPRAI